MDKLYFDYRIQQVVKNLDISFLAPEMYNELIVVEDDHMFNSNTVYQYLYRDKLGCKLSFTFDMKDLMERNIDFRDALNMYFEQHNFVAEDIIRKCWYVTESFLEELKGGTVK